ncbi:MAG: PDC sensor domain-containing protein, partial [Elioraea sp.]|nr:PDC sensor domain-containing protein [Elioraea sp.]
MTLRPARRLAGLLPWAAAALGAAIVAAVALAALYELRAALRRAESEAAALADSAAEAVSRRLEAVEFALSAIAASVQPDALEDPSHRNILHGQARRALAVSEGAYAFIVLDGKGDLVATSRTPPERMQRVSLAESPAFLSVARDLRPSLSVSERYIGRVGHAAGKPVVAVGLPVFDREGGVGAVVSAILPAEGPGALLPMLATPQDVVVVLTLTDGTVIGRLPGWADRPSLAAKVEALPDALIAARPVRGGTSAVVVLRTRHTVISGWLGVALPSGAAAFSLAAVLIVLAQRLSRTLVRLDRANAE